MIATLRQNGQIISELTKKFIWETFIGNANILHAKIDALYFILLASVAISVILIYYFFCQMFCTRGLQIHDTKDESTESP